VKLTVLAPVVVGGSATATATEQGGGGAGGGLPTVTRAIQLAGELLHKRMFAIQIRRLTKSGVGQNVDVNLWKLLRGDTNQDTIVQDGDTVVIPTAKNTNPADATALADASFSPTTIQVSVVGEVKNLDQHSTQYALESGTADCWRVQQSS